MDPSPFFDTICQLNANITKISSVNRSAQSWQNNYIGAGFATILPQSLIAKGYVKKETARLKISNRNGNKWMRKFKGLLLCVLIFWPILECSTVPAKSESNWVGYTESGKASYYAAKFQSKKTASGELYDRAKKTAAHNKLPFGKKVKVTNTKNSKSVIVKINDRGPHVKGRIIDLSGSAFSRIANLDTGVIQVRIEVIK